MLPAGRYFIGDPCYVLDNNSGNDLNESWDEVCGLIISGHSCLRGEFQLKSGRLFSTYSTCYGDGVYEDGDGCKYPVDAGMIGAVQLREGDNLDGVNGLGTIREFARPFHTFCDSEGNIHIGDLVIPTSDDEEEEEHFGFGDDE